MSGIKPGSLAGIFALDSDGRIQGLRVNELSARTIVIDTDAYIYGNILPPRGNTVLFADGSASFPSITFANDDTTGFYLLAPGELGVAANGTSVGSFQSDGLHVTSVNTGSTQITSGSSATTSTYPFVLQSLQVKADTINYYSLQVLCSTGTLFATFVIGAKVSNVAGTVTINTDYSHSFVDDGLTASVTLSSSGSNLRVNVSGSEQAKWTVATVLVSTMSI